MGLFKPTGTLQKIIKVSLLSALISTSVIGIN